jgi:hypothetical protein
MKIVDEKDIPDDAVQMHLYDWKNVMMPRGSKQKESVYEGIFPRLVDVFESFTDPKYGDNPNPYELLGMMYLNLSNEMQYAWRDFIKLPIVAKKLDDYYKNRLEKERRNANDQNNYNKEKG